MNIRVAATSDWEAIVEIYNHAIAEGHKTADTEPISLEQRGGWFAQHEGNTYPIFVIEDAGHVVAWCSLSPHRPGRKALRGIAEISYYVHPDHRRRGLARALVEHALSSAPQLGFRHLFAILLDVNAASIRLLEQTGFSRWGHLPNIADFDGFICGQVIYGRATQSAGV